jgi:hypothetical protein
MHCLSLKLYNLVEISTESHRRGGKQTDQLITIVNLDEKKIDPQKTPKMEKEIYIHKKKTDPETQLTDPKICCM